MGITTPTPDRIAPGIVRRSSQSVSSLVLVFFPERVTTRRTAPIQKPVNRGDEHHAADQGEEENEVVLEPAVFRARPDRDGDAPGNRVPEHRKEQKIDAAVAVLVLDQAPGPVLPR
jgi:hypothetical protein